MSLLATTLQKGDLDIDLQQGHVSGVAREDQIHYTYDSWGQLINPRGIVRNLSYQPIRAEYEASV